jgi:hypothetical protein
MRTLADIAEAALDYTDVSGGAENLSSATDRQLKALCMAIGGALQELYAAKPEAFRLRAGAVLKAPASQSVTLTAGSSAVSLAGFGRDLRGCSVKTGALYNQIAPSAASPGAALVTPWSGATGTETLTAYSDAILVASPVLGDVHLEGYGPLKPVPDRASYTAARDEYRIADYGMRQPTVARPRWSGQPEVWWAEAAAVGGQQVYLRFAPLPEREYRVTYDLACNPAVPEIADLSGGFALPVPDDFADSILLPYVLQRWTGSPWFRNAEAVPEIGRQYKVAAAMLADWGAQYESGSQIIVAAY